MTQSRIYSKEDIIEGKMYAFLSYISILCIIPLILRKNNPYVLDHGKQGLVIFVAQVGTFILSILMPFMFSPLMFILMILSFWGMVSVILGLMVRLPIVSGIADKVIL